MSSLVAMAVEPEPSSMPSRAREIVRAVALRKSYLMGATEVRALRGVDLSIRPRELVAIMGPSGSGKSTLLHLVGGLSTPSSGRLFVAGRELAKMSDAGRTELRRTSIGFVFQKFNLFPTLTVEGNIGLAERIRYGSWRAREEKRQELLKILGLGHLAHHRPAELSGGEQQRVAIARALVHEPPLLLADEPTGSLDSENARAVLEVLVDLNRRLGQTIVLITHDPEVAGYATRRVYMRDGRIYDERR